MKLSDRLGSVHAEPCMRVSQSFGASTLLDMGSRKIHQCKTHQSYLGSKEYQSKSWVDYIGSSPEEINKGLNQGNRDENEEMMVFRKIEVFKSVRIGT